MAHLPDRHPLGDVRSIARSSTEPEWIRAVASEPLLRRLFWERDLERWLPDPLPSWLYVHLMDHGPSHFSLSTYRNPLVRLVSGSALTRVFCHGSPVLCLL